LTSTDKKKLHDYTLNLILPLLKFTPNLLLFGITSLYGNKLNQEIQKNWKHSNLVVSEVLQIVKDLDEETMQRIVARLYYETGSMSLNNKIKNQ